MNYRLKRWLAAEGLCRPEPDMTLPRSAAEVLSEHVALEVECIDRMYLNVSAPRGTLTYPLRSREGLEAISLGLMAYPTPKGKRRK